MKILQGKFLILTIFILSSIGLIFSSGCKKSFSVIPGEVDRLTELQLLDSFFDIEGISETGIIQITEDLKRKNSSKPFVRELLASQGFPVWSKAQIVKKGDRNRPQTKQNSIRYLIPLVKGIQNSLSAIILSEQVGDKINYTLFRNGSYRQFAEPKDQKSITDLFLFMEAKSFGRNLFKLSVPSQDTTENFSTFDLLALQQREIQNDVVVNSSFSTEVCIIYDEYYYVIENGIKTSTPTGNFIEVCTSMWVQIPQAAIDGGASSYPWSWAISEPSGTSNSSGGGYTTIPEPGPNPNEPGSPQEPVIDNGYLPIATTADGAVLKYNNYGFWNQVTDGEVGKTSATTTMLRDQAAAKGWNVGLTPVEFNQKVGKAFEESALKFFGLKENGRSFAAPQRQQMNLMDPNKPKAVRPDAIDHFMLVSYNQYGTQSIDALPGTFAVEVKAFAGTLELSSSDYQAMGELEFLRSNVDKLASQQYFQALTPPFNINTFKSGPILLYITAGNTQIGASIIQEAALKKVNIWQSTALVDPSTGQLTFTRPRVKYSKDSSIPLNSIVPIDQLLVVLEGLPSPVPVNLANPTTPNFSLDPETID